jgi:hypothetical protein
MMTLAVILAVLGMIITAVCGLINHWRDTDAVKSMTELVVKGCPPKDRADVVRAVAELASRLHGEPKRGTLAELLLRLFQHRPPAG